MTEAAAAAAANGSQPAASAAAGAGAASGTGGGQPAGTAPASTTTAPATSGTPAPAAAGTQAAASEPVYDLKPPAGFDAAAVPKIVELAKAYGIAPDKAQKLLDETHARQVQAKADLEAALAKQKAEWHEAIKADKDYGGEKFQASLERANKVVGEIDAKIAPGIKQILDSTGYGDHPAVVRLFNYLGQQNREDTFAGGGGNSAGADVPMHERWYPPPKS